MKKKDEKDKRFRKGKRRMINKEKGWKKKYNKR